MSMNSTVCISKYDFTPCLLCIVLTSHSPFLKWSRLSFDPQPNSHSADHSNLLHTRRDAFRPRQLLGANDVPYFDPVLFVDAGAGPDRLAGPSIDAWRGVQCLWRR